jgi:hypothetical protein
MLVEIFSKLVIFEVRSKRRTGFQKALANWLGLTSGVCYTAPLVITGPEALLDVPRH